ncbi:MAG: hypothetical protein MJ072_00160, partial [Clostridia bacterium]|nr:hypothetical protein [Clostridia bacterium]
MKKSNTKIIFIVLAVIIAIIAIISIIGINTESKLDVTAIKKISTCQESELNDTFSQAIGSQVDEVSIVRANFSNTKIKIVLSYKNFAGKMITAEYSCYYNGQSD